MDKSSMVGEARNYETLETASQRGINRLFTGGRDKMSVQERQEKIGRNVQVHASRRSAGGAYCIDSDKREQ